MNPEWNALIIDDEPLARLELKRLLRAHPEVKVAGEAATVNEARQLLGQPGYDLVFLDIQLRGGSGFDLIDRLAPKAEIVFVTAYDQYAVRAFEVNALDYLLKPVTPTRLKATLQRLAAARKPDALPPGLPAKLNRDDRVFIKSGTVTRFIPVTSIVAVRSSENYTEVLLEDGAKVLVLRSLKSWEEALPPESFLRVHRQALVNLAHVKSIVRVGEDEVRFELSPPGTSIPASRRQVAELRQRFEAAGLGGLFP